MALRVEGVGRVPPPVHPADQAARLQQVVQAARRQAGSPTVEGVPEVARHEGENAQGRERVQAERAARRPRAMETYARFVVDEETNELQIKIIDARTGEVLTAIPPDELLRLARALEQYKGMLLESRK